MQILSYVQVGILRISESFHMGAHTIRVDRPFVEEQAGSIKMVSYCACKCPVLPKPPKQTSNVINSNNIFSVNSSAPMPFHSTAEGWSGEVFHPPGGSVP